MARMKLTAMAVAQRKAPKSGQEDVYDKHLPGFGVRVSYTGTKTYFVMKRLNGKLRRFSLGRADDEAREDYVSLKEARLHAGKTAAELAHDRVQAPRVAEPKPDTFGAIADKYIETECPGLVRGAEVKSAIERGLIPRIGDVPIVDLRKRHVRGLTDALVAKGKPGAAYKVYETAKRIMNWALEYYDEDEIEIEVSPWANLKPPVKKTPRSRALKDAEMKALWPAWDMAGYPFGPMLKLLLLTGQRRSEVAGLAWGEVDLEKAEWVIPAERSKSRREHIVPLSDMAVAILEGLPHFNGGDFIFSTTSGRVPVSGFSKAKSRADTSSGIAAWRIHDLRRTCRTRLAELGVPEIVSERVLNHAPRGLAAVYNVFEYREEKRDALQRWANRLRDLTAPPPPNVVKMKA